MTYKYTIKKLILVSFLTGTIISCSENINSSDVVLSKVGNRTLYLSQVLIELSDYELKSDSARAVDEYISAWEKRVVLRNEAERLGLHQHTSFQNELNTLEDVLLGEAVIKMYLTELDTITISDAEWQEFSKSNSLSIKVTEPSLLLYNFTSTDADTIKTYRERIIANQKPSLIEEFKLSKPDWWFEQQVPISIKDLEKHYPNLSTFWRTAKNGQVSEILSDTSMFQFFCVVNRLESGSVLDTASVRPYIEQWLLQQKKNRKLKALEENLMVNARQNKVIQRPKLNTQ